MTKHPNSPNLVPPPKRSRKPAGFRVAQRPPPNSQTPSSSCSNSSLFVTVSQPDELCVSITAKTRVLSSTQDQPPPPIVSPEAEPVEQWNESVDIEPPPEQEPVKPKRKRNTKNMVHNSYAISGLPYSNSSSGPT